jgi:DNA-binding transcriptional regulator YhcF (GntR family)
VPLACCARASSNADACGELAAGERLPSVRDLAEAVGVAPMTVSQVYRD